MTETITREEKLLSAISDGSKIDFSPITREEMFLAKAAGMDLDVPDPITRKEILLSKISSNGETGGSVNDDRVKYVTFIGLEGFPPYKMPVIVGDTCHDPVSKGYIETPTKESTVSQVFTFSGWSLTEGGSASSSALTNVTEDRTVYVAFKESVRKYTITYYDSDGTTVLKTEEKTYGSTVTYIPEKSGYSFVEWQPSVETVTGDASYTASWEEKTTFAGGAWEDIIEIAESGEATNYFSVGDTRTEQLTYTDGSTEEITLTIIGINVDTASSITVMSNVLEENRQFVGSPGYSAGYLNDSDLASLDRTSLRWYFLTTLLGALPKTVRGAFKKIDRSCGSGVTINDGLFPFYDTELFSKYPFFKTDGVADATKRIGYKNDGTASSYRLRNTKDGYNSYIINTNGSTELVNNTSLHGVRFGFCI